MCFSAEASFSGAAVLSVIGVATIKKVQHPSQLIFASIPLLFACQQISEGFLWLSLSNPVYSQLQQFTTYTFLFFAQVIWPLWIPFGTIMLDKKENRTKIQKAIVVTGCLLSLTLAYLLLMYNAEAKIMEHHIKYFQSYPAWLRPYGAALYVIATIFSLFISKIKGVRLLGITILLSYIIAAVFFEHYKLSVWCFFAAIISISIFNIIKGINKHKNKIATPVSLDLQFTQH